MREAHPKNFDHVVHPYIFVLKEGKRIQRDFLDYSLLMLQVGKPDILQSPRQWQKPSTPVVHLLRK